MNSDKTTSDESQYKCAKCHDTGWITTKRDGYTFTAECDCRKAKSSMERLERSGLRDSVMDMRFETFTHENPWQESLLSVCTSYVDELCALYESNPGRKKFPWLFIGGNPGSGKTHLCTAVCGRMIEYGKSVRYMQWIQEARRAKSYLTDPAAFEDVIYPYVRADILYIDDLFKSIRPMDTAALPSPTDADLKVAFELLNARYLQNNPTLITSEWFLADELMAVDEGTFSRVYDRTQKGRYACAIGRGSGKNYRK